MTAVGPKGITLVKLGGSLLTDKRRPETDRPKVIARLAREIATRAALSIDNARRYSRERATAVTLQRSLLQRGTPVQSAVDVATRYLPAGTRAGVGGDRFAVGPLRAAGHGDGECVGGGVVDIRFRGRRILRGSRVGFGSSSLQRDQRDAGVERIRRAGHRLHRQRVAQ